MLTGILNKDRYQHSAFLTTFLKAKKRYIHLPGRILVVMHVKSAKKNMC